MTRDFELIRKLLLQIEDAPAGEPLQSLTVDESLDEAVLGRHLELLIDAGLIEGQVIGHRPVSFVIHGLTWSGHDFVEHARNESVWRSVFENTKAAGTSITLEILKGLLANAAAKLAGLG